MTGWRAWRGWSCGDTTAGSPRIGVPGGYSRSFRVGPVMVYQRPDALNQTDDSQQWTCCPWGWLGIQLADWRKCTLHDTTRLPVPQGWMKRCCKDRGVRVFLFVYLFILFLIKFGEHVTGVRGRYRWIWRWVGLGCMMWNSQRTNKELKFSKK